LAGFKYLSESESCDQERGNGGYRTFATKCDTSIQSSLADFELIGDAVRLIVLSGPFLDEGTLPPPSANQLLRRSQSGKTRSIHDQKSWL